MEFELTTLVVIGSGCTGSCKFNYHTTSFLILFDNNCHSTIVSVE